MSSLLLKPAGILFPVPQGSHPPQAKPDFVKKLFLYYPFHRYIGVLPAPVELWKVLFEVINVSFFSSSVGNEAGEVKVGVWPGWKKNHLLKGFGVLLRGVFLSYNSPRLTES